MESWVQCNRLALTDGINSFRVDFFSWGPFLLSPSQWPAQPSANHPAEPGSYFIRDHEIDISYIHLPYFSNVVFCYHVLQRRYTVLWFVSANPYFSRTDSHTTLMRFVRDFSSKDGEAKVGRLLTRSGRASQAHKCKWTSTSMTSCIKYSIPLKWTYKNVGTS